MKKLAFIYIILAGVLWGTSGIFVHYLAPHGFTSLQMTFLRSTVSLICMAIYILISNRKLFRVKAEELILFAGSGLSFFLTASCYYYSMQATSISTAVVLMYTAPIFVVIYSVAFLGEKLSAIKLASIICMITGCGLVSGIIGGLKFDALGIGVGFLSGLSYSAYNILTKIEMSRNSNPVSATLYCFLFATVIGAFVSNASDALQHLTVDILPLVAAMGVCTCILPYFLYTLALKEIYAGTASALGIIEPMAATVFSVAVFHEPLGISSVCGIILILGAVIMLSKSENR